MIELEKLLSIMNTMSDSELTEFRYEDSEVKLRLKKSKRQEIIVSDACEHPALKKRAEGKTSAEADDWKESEESFGNLVESPLVGTFYAAPAEDAETFVHVGDHVKKGQTLAIVEAMKLMNEIESDYDGTVAEIYVENKTAVEYGQKLFRIV